VVSLINLSQKRTEILREFFPRASSYMNQTTCNAGCQMILHYSLIFMMINTLMPMAVFCQLCFASVAAFDHVT